mgnify:FL=1
MKRNALRRLWANARQTTQRVNQCLHCSGVRRCHCRNALLVISFLLMLTPAFADTWKPTKPIEIVVPYPPGGGADKWGRVVSRIFNDHGWESFVSNKPGADTTIGSNYVAGAPADGHTLYMASNGFLDANLASKEPPAGINYSEKSFTDIAQIGFGSFVLVVSKN